MSKDLKRIIVGSKSIAAYIPALVFEFSKSDVVELSAVGSNIDKLERLVRLMVDISLKPITESGRKTEKFRDIDATISILQKVK